MRALLRAIVFIALPCFAVQSRANDFSVAPDVSGGLGHYKWDIGIDGAAATGNPPLYLARGSSYTFMVSTTTLHPFWIKTIQGAGSLNGYAGGGLSANPTTTADTVTFDVPANAPETLYYDCGNHPEMTGPIYMVVFRSGFD